MGHLARLQNLPFFHNIWGINSLALHSLCLLFKCSLVLEGVIHKGETDKLNYLPKLPKVLIT